MDKTAKQAIMKEHARSEGDVGSVEVQVAVLTHRIRELTEHLKTHRSDHSSRRGLIAMVNRRRRLMRYLRGESSDRYQALAAKLGLRRGL
jgi:small subunit ribosomal protein S15